MKRIGLTIMVVILLIAVAACATPAQNPNQTTAAVRSSSGSTAGSANPSGGSSVTGTSAQATPGAYASELPSILKQDPRNAFWMKDISPVTLTAFIDVVVPDGFTWGEDPTTQYITERTGVKLDIEYAPDKNGTRLNLMLASGETLPDLIGYVPPASAAASDLIEGQYVLCAEDLINQYAPEMWDLYPLKKDQKTFASTTQDGKMWGFVYGYSFDGDSPYGYMHGYIAVRSDILEAMGKTNLDIKTTDDFLASLREFDKIKHQFPAVEYPIYLKSILPQFSAIFGDAAAGDIRYDPVADTLSFWFERDAGKQTLKFFNQLYRDGYLKQESIITTNEIISDLGAGKAFYYFDGNVWASSSANTPLQKTISPNAWYMPSYPFSGAGEKMMRTFKGLRSDANAWWVTASSKNIERAVGFLEYMTTEEGILTLNNGIPNVHWKVSKDQNGLDFPEFIGEAGELMHSGKAAEAKEKFGFNNFSAGLWLYHDLPYNFLWNHDVNMVNSLNPDNLKKARQLWYVETTDNKDLSGVPNMVTVDPSTDAGVLQSTLRTIYQAELVKAVFTDSDSAFNTTYEAMIQALKAAGKDRFWQLYRPLFDEKLNLYKSIIN